MEERLILSMTMVELSSRSRYDRVMSDGDGAYGCLQMMLHQLDTAMILMDNRNEESLFKLDIETGNIVEEWKAGPGIKMSHMAPARKFAQTEAESTIVCASQDRLFRVDPRLPGNKLVDGSSKAYSKNMMFSCIATTENGWVALAGEGGDIRLYDNFGKNAKTSIPGLGDPIIGIDVSKNGRWIVATCKAYLLVIDTKIREGRYAGYFGFNKSFDADKKPVPKRLQLRSEHLTLIGGSVNFSPAK